jgi:hypothetical protein
MEDIRIILFLIVFLFSLRINKENFEVQPIVDNSSIETNLKIEDFLKPNNEKDFNYELNQLYDMTDKVSDEISKTEDLLDFYDNKYCSEDCNTCRPPDLSEIDPLAEFDSCGVQGIIPLNSVCKLKCKGDSIELSSTAGVCKLDEDNISSPYPDELFKGEYKGKFIPSPSIKCSPSI